MSQDSWLDVRRRDDDEYDYNDDETQATADTGRATRLDDMVTDDTVPNGSEEVLRLDEDEAAQDAAESELVGLDENLPSSEVLNRIEQVVAQLVEDVCAPRTPTLQLVTRAVPALQQQDNGQDQVVPPGGRLQTRSLLSSQGAGAFAFARVFLILETAHELLRASRKATQRDIYYKLINPPLISSQADVNCAIQDAVALLRVPRSSLGICCAPRGAVSGKLQVRDGPMSPWQDCSTAGMAGRSIPGCPEQIDTLGLRCTARYLLVVEKDAIFQSLTQDRLFDTIPCVLVTAKGMPDLATRAFCAKLKAEFPALTVLGLVDWNPSGVVILKTYKYGIGSLDGSRFALPSLSWLGLRSNMLSSVDESQLQPLTRRDQTIAASLKSTLLGLGQEDWCDELDDMISRGLKAEIECMYSLAGGMAGLCGILSQAIIRREYV